MPVCGNSCNEPVLLLAEEEGQAWDAEVRDADHGVIHRHRKTTTMSRVVAAGMCIGALVLCHTIVGIVGEGSHQPLIDTDEAIQKTGDVSMWAQHASEMLTPKYWPRRYVVFRCHPEDYAGGFGDRISGVLGAAYLALSTGRELKIDWPDLSLIFVENLVHWRTSYAEMGVSERDQRILNSTAVERGFAGYPDKNFKGLSDDVQVLNGLDTDVAFYNDWRSRSNLVTMGADKSRVLVFSGNRAGSPEWLQTIPTVPKNIDFWELYHAIFDALFVPNPVFTAMSVSLQITAAGRGSSWSSSPLDDLLNSLRDPNTYSVAAHIRAGDPVIRAEATMTNPEAECELIDQPQYYQPRLQCLDSMGSSKSSFANRILLVFSDSLCAKKHITEYYAKSFAFTEVWTQHLMGDVNIDSTIAVDQHQTLYEGLRDWVLLKSVNEYAITTAYTFVSGFPSSSIIASSTNKELRDLNSCKPMNKKWLCAGRFC